MHPLLPREDFEILVIAFDTFFLAKRFRNVGIYEYARNLLGEFQRLAVEDHSVDIRYFVFPGYSDVLESSRSSLRFEAIRTRWLNFPKLWSLGVVSFAAVQAHADLIFSPSPQILPLGFVPVATTIHDAIPLKLPPQMVGNNRALKMYMSTAARKSKSILTDSEHSRKDLVEIYNLSPEKVSVVHLGYDKRNFNAIPVDDSRQADLWRRLGIRSPYILHHGMVQLRKNVGALVEAYSLLLEQYGDWDFQLVLAGPFGLGAEEILRMADGLVRNGKVIFTGPLAETEMPLLIKGASLCVIPSLYEGFCLPMVEAMACGTPTVVANSSCLPEISGGALRYFDPRSVEDMAATMVDVLQHVELQRELAANGLRRANEFSWQRCAQETLAVLRGMGACARGEIKERLLA
jgi:glycosyltransferase involved in cell wall biosynthesis